MVADQLVRSRFHEGFRVAAGGEDDGGQQNHGAAEPGYWAESLVQDEDAEQRADEGLHVEEDGSL